jgi:hypothetical protein
MFSKIEITRIGERFHVRFDRVISENLTQYSEMLLWLRDNCSNDFRIVNNTTIALSTEEDATLLVLRWQS